MTSTASTRAATISRAASATLVFGPTHSAGRGQAARPSAGALLEAAPAAASPARRTCAEHLLEARRSRAATAAAPAACSPAAHQRAAQRRARHPRWAGCVWPSAIGGQVHAPWGGRRDLRGRLSLAGASRAHRHAARRERAPTVPGRGVDCRPPEHVGLVGRVHQRALVDQLARVADPETISTLCATTLVHLHERPIGVRPTLCNVVAAAALAARAER